MATCLLVAVLGSCSGGASPEGGGAGSDARASSDAPTSDAPTQDSATTPDLPPADSAGAPDVPPGPSNDCELPAPTRTIKAATISELVTAIGAAMPGDRIELADGVHRTTSAISVRRSGQSDKPIVIAAASVGKAEITGAAGFSLSGVQYVVIDGFRHTVSQDSGPGFECSDCRNVRVMRNHFQFATASGASSNWVSLTGSNSRNNRVDHNTFTEKSTQGVMLLFKGPSGTTPWENRADHNYFLKHTNPMGTPGEAIRIGESSLSLSTSKSVVELNLFEECSGDTEVITNKSSDNILRWNTFRNNEGSITLRHGNRATVEGNYFLPGRNGIRLYGHDHKIINNYFEGTTGGGTLTTLTVGTGNSLTDLSESNAVYSQPKNVVIAFNTLVGNATHFVLGAGSNQYVPLDTTVAYNIFKGDRGTLVTVNKEEGTKWEGNILHGSASDGDIPTSGFRRLDPMLAQDTDGILRLADGSLAIDAATMDFPFVTFDMDIQMRSLPRDVGADERTTSSPTRRALTPADVGPASCQ